MVLMLRDIPALNLTVPEVATVGEGKEAHVEYRVRLNVVHDAFKEATYLPRSF